MSFVPGIRHAVRCFSPQPSRCDARLRLPPNLALRALVFLFTAALAFLPVSAATAPRVLLLDAALAASHVIAVGERGTILRSTDSGKTWTRSTTPAAAAAATLTGVSFAPDSPLGWAVGHHALILATTDSGLTWRKQWQGEDLESSFLDVCAIDTRHIIAVGAYGWFVESRDGGTTWTPRTIINGDMHLNRVSRGPTGTLYLAGERGTLLRSSDSAETWQPLNSPYAGSFYGLLPLSPRVLLAYGLRGHAFHSNDDGNTWERISIDHPILLATAVKTKAGSLLLAGEGRALYSSRDDGATFSSSAEATTAATAELLEAPDGSVLAFGEAGVATLPATTGALRPDSAPVSSVSSSQR